MNDKKKWNCFPWYWSVLVRQVYFPSFCAQKNTTKQLVKLSHIMVQMIIILNNFTLFNLPSLFSANSKIFLLKCSCLSSVPYKRRLILLKFDLITILNCIKKLLSWFLLQNQAMMIYWSSTSGLIPNLFNLHLKFPCKNSRGEFVIRY